MMVRTDNGAVTDESSTRGDSFERVSAVEIVVDPSTGQRIRAGQTRARYIRPLQTSARYCKREFTEACPAGTRRSP